MTTTSLTSPMSASSTSASSTSAAASTNPTDSKSLFANYSAFLTLLTTQLQHQDPLNPTDTAQYTQQLVEYASVEQEMKSNTALAGIQTAVTGNEAVGALGYVGRTVMAAGDTTSLANGAAHYAYTLASASATTQIAVKDSSGNTVYQTTGDTTSGTHQFTWNGTRSDGSTAPDGSYSISVSAASTSGTAIAATPYAEGIVSGIDSSSGSPALVIGTGTVGLSDVLYVGQAATTSAS